MAIQLSEHFTYKKLLRFVLPSIVMMIFTSIYGVVDGLFVSNYAGKTSFAAINLIMPVIMGISALGFMMGTGGSALVAKTLGEGDKEMANDYFSMIVTSTIIGGIILSIIGEIFTPQLARMIGADETMINDSVTYGRVLFASLTAFMLQNVFQSFLVTAEKPNLGLLVTVLAGLTNMLFDYLMVGVFRWEVMGAGIATAMSQIVGGIVPLIYFMRKNNSLLRIKKFKFDGMALLKVCANGSSELMTNLSISIVNMLYNFQLMKLAGKNGVAAYGTIMYVNFVFIAIFLGYSIGTAPIVGYHHGAGNTDELKNLFGKSLKLIGIFGVCLTVLAMFLSGTLSKIFVGYDEELFEMTSNAFRIYAISFLVCGFNIYASSFFTALNNGIISAVISFMRTLVFQILAVLILPILFGLNGIWLSITVAEVLSLIVTITFLVKNKEKYHYM